MKIALKQAIFWLFLFFRNQDSQLIVEKLCLLQIALFLSYELSSLIVDDFVSQFRRASLLENHLSFMFLSLSLFLKD